MGGKITEKYYEKVLKSQMKTFKGISTKYNSSVSLLFLFAFNKWDSNNWNPKGQEHCLLINYILNLGNMNFRILPNSTCDRTWDSFYSFLESQTFTHTKITLPLNVSGKTRCQGFGSFWLEASGWVTTFKIIGGKPLDAF